MITTITILVLVSAIVLLLSIKWPHNGDTFKQMEDKIIARSKQISEFKKTCNCNFPLICRNAITIFEEAENQAYREYRNNQI